LVKQVKKFFLDDGVPAKQVGFTMAATRETHAPSMTGQREQGYLIGSIFECSSNLFE